MAHSDFWLAMSLRRSACFRYSRFGADQLHENLVAGRREALALVAKIVAFQEATRLFGVISCLEEDRRAVLERHPELGQSSLVVEGDLRDSMVGVI